LIVTTSEKGSRYWGEIPEADMLHVLEIAEKDGYQIAMTFLEDKYPDLANYVLSESRIDWLFHCYDQSNRKRCLDLGSGWGSISFLLTRFFEETISLERIESRCKFQNIRAKQEQTQGLRLVVADLWSLPFRDNEFDLIVLNGVLEWAAFSRDSDPRSFQLQCLREVNRCLKPGGCAYIGIENRFGLPYWFGARDHTSLPFTSLLPRRISNGVVSRLLKSQGWSRYYTYTYSFKGYRRLLDEAGFEEMELYWVYPSYNYPRFAAKLQIGDAYSFFANQYRAAAGVSVGKRLASSFGSFLPSGVLAKLCPFFWPSYLIFGWKSFKPETFEDKIAVSMKANSLVRISSENDTSSEVYFARLERGKLRSVSQVQRHYPLKITPVNSSIKHYLLQRQFPDAR